MINQKAVFTYLFSYKPDSEFPINVPVKNSGYFLNISSKTEYLIAENDNAVIVIVGLCVDTKGELERDSIPQKLLDIIGNGICELTDYAGRFAGNYVVIAITDNGSYAFTDAIGALQIAYTNYQGNICFSSHDGLLARHCGYNPSDDGVNIRKASPLYQQMPYDATIYNEIKVLLPNHYIDLHTGVSTRYYPLKSSAKKLINVSEAVSLTIERIKNTITEYSKYYKNIPSLTAGWDSRVVFSCFKDTEKMDEVFTIMHPGMTNDSADIWVSKKIADNYSVKHNVLNNKPCDDGTYNSICKYLGPYVDRATVDMANTILSGYPEQAIINGNIIEQLGRNFCGLDAPSFLINTNYFMSNARNFSIGAKEQYKAQLAELKNSVPSKYRFDMFNWENFCGRWITQGSAVYSYTGVTLLNIFNCRDILTSWTQVPRSVRVKKRIHTGIINTLDEKLLTVPINPHKPAIYKYKNNWVYNYCAINAKHDLKSEK